MSAYLCEPCCHLSNSVDDETIRLAGVLCGMKMYPETDIDDVIDNDFVLIGSGIVERSRSPGSIVLRGLVKVAA